MATQPNVDEKTTTTPPVEDISPEDSHESGEDVNEGSQPQPNGDETDGGGLNTRIRKLSADKKRLAQEVEYYKRIALSKAQEDEARTRNIAPNPAPQPAPIGGYPQDEVQRAVQTLKSQGFVTEEVLQRFAENLTSQFNTRAEWDRQHSKNEADINRSKGNLPHYDRDEVEQYAREHGLASPLAAYRDMYFDEIVDSYKRTSPKSSGVTSNRPSKPDNTSKEPLNLESFREKFLTDRKFQDELRNNPGKFDEIMKELATQG